MQRARGRSAVLRAVGAGAGDAAAELKVGSDEAFFPDRPEEAGAPAPAPAQGWKPSVPLAQGWAPSAPLAQGPAPAPAGAESRPCVTQEDDRATAIGYATSPPGTPCIFGLADADEGSHCINDDGRYGSFGWCFTAPDRSAFGSCSEDCPLFGPDKKLMDQIKTLRDTIEGNAATTAAAAPAGAESKPCVTQEDPRVVSAGWVTPLPGTRCIFGLLDADEGSHCVYDDGRYGSFGWCYTAPDRGAWGSCSEDCPLFGADKKLEDQIEALRGEVEARAGLAEERETTSS